MSLCEPSSPNGSQLDIRQGVSLDQGLDDPMTADNQLPTTVVGCTEMAETNPGTRTFESSGDGRVGSGEETRNEKFEIPETNEPTRINVDDWIVDVPQSSLSIHATTENSGQAASLDQAKNLTSREDERVLSVNRRSSVSNILTEDIDGVAAVVPTTNVADVEELEYKDQVRSMRRDRAEKEKARGHGDRKQLPRRLMRVENGPEFKDQVHYVQDPDNELRETGARISVDDYIVTPGVEGHDGISSLTPQVNRERNHSNATPVISAVPIEDIACVDAEPIDSKETTKRLCFVFALLVLAGLIYLIILLNRDTNSTPTEVQVPDPPVSAFETACLEAMPISVGQTLNVSTVNATASNASVCGGADYVEDSPGVWFKFENKQNISWVSISTCTDNGVLRGEFDSQMVVYTGTCGNLECLVGNDNEFTSCGREAGVEFAPSPLATYYVYVYGSRSGVGGDFELEVKDLPRPPPNDKCPQAVPLGKNEPQQGSGYGARGDVGLVCDYLGDPDVHYVRGVWYSFDAEAETTVEFEYCPSISENATVVIMKGGCDDNRLKCFTTGALLVSGSECKTISRWRVDEPTNFFALIESGGDFTIKVTEEKVTEEKSFGQAVMVQWSAALGTILCLLLL